MGCLNPDLDTNLTLGPGLPFVVVFWQPGGVLCPPMVTDPVLVLTSRVSETREQTNVRRTDTRKQMLQYFQKLCLRDGIETCLDVNFHEIQFWSEVDQYEGLSDEGGKPYNLPSWLRGRDSLKSFSLAYTWSDPNTDAPKRCGLMFYILSSQFLFQRG